MIYLSHQPVGEGLRAAEILFIEKPLRRETYNTSWTAPLIVVSLLAAAATGHGQGSCRYPAQPQHPHQKLSPVHLFAVQSPTSLVAYSHCAGVPRLRPDEIPLIEKPPAPRGQ